MLLLFQDTINQWLTEVSDKAAIDDVTEIIEEEAELPIVVTQAQAERDELADLIADISDINEQEAAGLESIDLKKTKEPVQRPVSAVPAEPIVSVPDFLKQDWVMAQPVSHYTFQLMGSWEREEVYDFIDQYALVGDVAVFENMRNSQVWHVLVYGSFKDKQAALKASAAWPAPLNTLPSWLRKMSSVQQQIKDKAVISQ